VIYLVKLYHQGTQYCSFISFFFFFNFHSPRQVTEKGKEREKKKFLPGYG